jgi:integrase
MKSLYYMKRGGFRADKGWKKSQADKVLSRDEFKALLSVVGQEANLVYKTNAYSLFTLAGNFGLRCSEAISLEKSHFRTLPMGYLTVNTLKQKAYKEDRIYVGSEGKKLCEKILADQSRMSSGPKLFPFTSRTARYYFAFYASKAGISPNVSFHSFRHCAAHMTWDAVKDIRIVNAFLRHKPTTTEVYLYPSAKEMIDAIEKRGIVW